MMKTHKLNNGRWELALECNGKRKLHCKIHSSSMTCIVLFVRDNLIGQMNIGSRVL